VQRALSVCACRSSYSLDLNPCHASPLVSFRTKTMYAPCSIFAIFALKCTSIPFFSWYHPLGRFIFISDTFPGQNLVTFPVLGGSCADWERLTVSQPHSACPKQCTRMADPSSLVSKEPWQALLVRVLRSKELPAPVSRIQTPSLIEVLPGTAEIR
jgi:hypothetical protein